MVEQLIFFASRFFKVRWCLMVAFCTIMIAARAQGEADTLPVISAAIAVQDSDYATLDSFYLAHAIDLKSAVNLPLYYEIYHWYHTRYRYGGNSKYGVDCSHFVNMLSEKIYSKTLGSSAPAIWTQCKVIKKGLKAAQEGDILFFKIKKGQISHVGIYLQNGKFAHASVHSGVTISDISEAYYKKRFYKVGRME